MSSIPTYRFYGAEISYFSSKVRPALRYKNIHFAEILPTPAAYAEVILPRTGLGFIPILITPDDETLQDTSIILDALEQRFPERPLYPSTPVQRVAAYVWELYADEFLLLPAMHYRWNTEEGEAKARGDFAAFSGNPETANRFADIMSGSLPMLGVLPETQSGIEAHTLELLDRLSAHLDACPYLLGGRPSLADCASMGPLYGHLYLDAVPGRLLRDRAQPVCHWVERMNHPDPAEDGSWYGSDELPSTLMPLLELIGRDAIPLILDSARAFDTWADERPPDLQAPPRAVGMHETELRGVRFQRYTSAYTPWMVQRPIDAYQALTTDQRAAVDGALAGTGCEDLLRFQPRHRVHKRGFELALD